MKKGNAVRMILTAFPFVYRVHLPAGLFHDGYRANEHKMA